MMQIYNETNISYRDSKGFNHNTRIIQTSHEMYFEYKNRVKMRLEELRNGGYTIVKIKEN